MSQTAISETLRARLLAAAADTGEPTVIRLAALLWQECPVDALELAVRSQSTIERLAATRHPGTPERSMPMLVRTGAEEDRLFWIGVVMHVTTDFENGGERGWKHLLDAATVLAELARGGVLVDTPTHALGRDLIDAASVETPREGVARLAQHPLPLVTALLLARRDLPEAAEVGMLLGEPHPVIAEKLALRTRSPLVLAALGEKYLAKGDRRAASEWRPVEREIAASPHTPRETVDALIALSHFDSWWYLAENPAIAPATQVLVLERGRARRGPLRADGTYRPVARDFEIEALARNAGATAETIEELSGHASAHVRVAVADRSRISEEIATRLGADGDPKVRAAIARRPDLPASLARTLADDSSPDVVRALAGNPRAPEDRRVEWEGLASTDTRMRDALARNPRTSPALLAEWLEATDARHGAAALRALFGLRISIAANPATPPERLATTARTASDSEEAGPAARNPSCPIDALEAIATAETAWMQKCLFENPACATRLLEHALGGLAADLFEAGLYRAARNALWGRTRSGGSRGAPGFA